MMNRLSLSVALLALGLTASAYAAPLTYQFTNSTQLAGTITFDSTTDKVTGGNFTFSDAAGTYTFGTVVFSVENVPFDTVSETDFTNLAGDNFYLNFRISDSKVCSTTNICLALGSFLDPAKRGAVDVAATTADLKPAVTPEPSSFILLGTGLVGFAGAARRRFLNA